MKGDRTITEEEAVEATREHLKDQRDFLARGDSREVHIQRAKDFIKWLNERRILIEPLEENNI